ncbi:MAG: hypothetical protein AB1782_19535 [Cyanobacteriota bacterium]
MPFSNKITHTSFNENENTVYFYPDRLKISYSSLEHFKGYLTELFKQDIRIEEKLKQCNAFFNHILRELINKGILKEDHTLVITDPIANKEIFQEVLKTAFNKTIDSKITITKPSKVKIIKRQILTALFIKKEASLKDFLSILKGQGDFYSSILNRTIDLKKHSQVKFSATHELEDYIINILTRTALLSQGCSIFTLRLYIEIIIELVIWYARSLAMMEGQKEVTPGILSTSIKLVDNYYITNPKFIKMLQGLLIGYIIKILN